MALIPCPECNHQVSSAAEACPRCGHPMVPKAPPAIDPTWAKYEKEAADARVAELKRLSKLAENRQTSGLAWGCGILLVAGVAFITYGAGRDAYREARPAPSVSQRRPALTPLSTPRPARTPMPAPVLRVKVDEFETGDFDYYVVRGTITNEGNAPASFVKVRADFYGTDKDKVLDTDWCFGIDDADLLPGQTRRWEIRGQDVSNAFKSVRCSIMED